MVKKKEDETVVDPVVETEETVVKPEKNTGESEAKKAFRKVIEAYKLKNPEKYELKKVVLEEQLNQL